MGSRSYPVRVPCAREGCLAQSHHEASSRRDEQRIRDETRGRWLCDEHQWESIRLTPTCLEKQWRSAPSDQRNYGRFWQNEGTIFGPGFQARARDFPPGTVLEVTVRAILPTEVKP